MFNPITIPYDCVMLFNVIQLKPEYTIDDAELVIGDMCNAVKNNYSNEGGFIAGQVFKYTGFISDEGSVLKDKVDSHIAIITYWDTFNNHEKSHGDCLFNKHFNKLIDMSISSKELGYEMLWQGEGNQ